MIERIFISHDHGAAQLALEQVEAQTGMGIVGDRNFGKAVHRGQNLTLVEAEQIEAFSHLHGRKVDLSITRRNLVTRGVELNSLLGKQFKVGEVVLFGVELCEPCVILGELLAGDELTSPKVIKHWHSRGGLRADVLVGGTLKVAAIVKSAP